MKIDTATMVAVTHDEMLIAREIRVDKQKLLISEFFKPVISFTLNIPGKHKRFDVAEMAFNEGLIEITEALKYNDVPILHSIVTNSKTGCEALLVVDGDAVSTKKLMMAIENEHSLGRLFDIDVLSEKGSIIKSEMFGRSARTCFICGGSVWLCSANRTHSAEELFNNVHGTLSNYFTHKYFKSIADNALRALFYELSVTPKPGLVDRKNNGSHCDMDFFTFIDSSCSLSSYFYKCAEIGAEFSSKPEQLFIKLRGIGVRAEARMYKTTNGANTHKGIIFSLGIMCAAFGSLYSDQVKLTPDKVSSLCAKISAAALADFENIRSNDEQIHKTKTTGCEVYEKYNIAGIRGEAANGFKTVFDLGYPILKRLIAEGFSINDAGIAALLNIIATIDDTNILGRSNMRVLNDVREKVALSLKTTIEADDYIQLANKLDTLFINKNISPGGAADLLALSFFVYFML